jgi:hypothetical protein
MSLKFKGENRRADGGSRPSVPGGRLSFKGDKPKKSKRKERAAEEDDDDFVAPAYSAEPQVGEGKLSTSGVVVMGHNTDFGSQIEVGDSILVTVSDRFRNTQVDESRVVNMVLGRSSLNIEAPFSCDVVAPASFMFVKRKPDFEALRAARKEEKKRARMLEEEEATVTYKTYKHGDGGVWKSWKTVTETVAAGTTREDMLDRRSKEKADRFCK